MMKVDQVTKALLGVIAILLFLNFVYQLPGPKPAVAARAGEEIGRYQISAWAAQAGAYSHHSGYYIVDTTTGKVVASKAEVHGPGE